MEGVRPVRPMRGEELSSDLPGGEAEARLQTRKFRSPTPNGKYVFDFASCRSMWVTHTDAGKPDLELNIIGEQPKSCVIAYILEDAMEPGRLDTITARSRMARKTGSN